MQAPPATTHPNDKTRGRWTMTDLAKTAVLEHLNTAVVVLGDDLTVCYMNPAAEAMLGTSEQRSTGCRVSDLIQADNLDELRELFTNGLTITRRAASFRTRDGAEVVADLTASLEPITHSLVVELQPMNRLLRINRDEYSTFSQETTRKLVSGLAHEVKNPLGGLRGAAQLLARQLDSDELREYTEVIISEADRLVTLVDTLLGPGGPPNKRDVNIHELIEYVIRLSEAEAGGALEFERDYDPGLPTLALDRDQIVQALLNLVKNARDALDNSGRILIRTRATTNFTIGDKRHATVATIEIEDDGPGIPAELQDSVFYPLVTSRSDGTGLGLPVAQDLISRHGGLIEFDSRPGRTVFYVHLPLVGTEPGRG